MHTEEKDGRVNRAISELEEGSEYHKKEGGLRVIAKPGIEKIAAFLRQRKQQASEPPPVEVQKKEEPVAAQEALDNSDNTETAEVPESGVEWLPGASGKACVRRIRTGSRIILCEVPGNTELVPVQVRDASFYRQGERFEVQVDPDGNFIPARPRMFPKYK
jgi:hypothetical protein